MKNKNILSVVAFIVIVIVAGFYLAGRQTSVVTKTDITGWKTFSDPIQGISFQYPESLSTTYINAFDWPPKTEITNGPFSCTEAGSVTAQGGQTVKLTIASHTYCKTTLTEGAAGSMYIQYAYAAQIKDKVIFFTFTLREPQCANYDDPKKSECETERTVFKIDPLIDQIIQTTTLTTPKPNITYINSSSDLIVVDSPTPDAVTGKNFSIIGKARGPWFFEASFPIELHDKNGKLLTTVVAHAQGEPGAWMTENFVPFKADVKVPASYIGPATLVLKKDNASGLPEHDASISFPITVEY